MREPDRTGHIPFRLAGNSSSQLPGVGVPNAVFASRACGQPAGVRAESDPGASARRQLADQVTRGEILDSDARTVPRPGGNPLTVRAYREIRETLMIRDGPPHAGIVEIQNL